MLSDAPKIKSFFDLDSTFAGLRPFEYAPFMCVSHPFYFDEQRPKLHHLVKEMYRFRGYVTTFYTERSKGLPAMEYHLGLKEPLRTTDFLETSGSSFFRWLPFSWEYAYLLRKATASPRSPAASVGDWFQGKNTWGGLSIFLLLSLFRKRQRRF